MARKYKQILKEVRSENPDLPYREAQKLASKIFDQENNASQAEPEEAHEKKNGKPKVIVVAEEPKNQPKTQIPKVVHVGGNQSPTSDIATRLRNFVSKYNSTVIVSGRLGEVGISQEQVRGRTFLIFGNVKLRRNTTSDLNWIIEI